MKNKVLVLLLMVAAMMVGQEAQAKANKQTVVFYTELHCQGCCDKVVKELSYVKGVKDVVCSMKDQTVTVTYDANKTDVKTLQEVFAKMNKPASLTPPRKGCNGCPHHCGHAA